MYLWFKWLHIATAVISITLFIARFLGRWRGAAWVQHPVVKVFPHVNDTLLFITGVSLIFMTHFYPLTPQGAWMTEKLVGVVLYIGLGHLAMSRRTISQMLRVTAFMAALLVFYFIVTVAVTKLPFIMGYA
ncbi:Invasion gene expression up-regulator, SirB [Leminorella richardii]|uniref:Invasion gene expression up-regulator, SirB n=1 Tax=Leminorella richardii TaxID=158841 RepID=A0A2X4USD6_9GAMM|nr:SirB2 family protein [Leminorella richardii]SQI41369.1 Invasion gene expression up-regulator, SirB [Leminorella richardii]